MNVVTFLDMKVGYIFIHRILQYQVKQAQIFILNRHIRF